MAGDYETAELIQVEEWNKKEIIEEKTEED